MIKRIVAIAFGVAFAAALGGCGEHPQVIEYKQGKYQGTLDTPPYDSKQFNGNKAEWERAIKTRNQNQNEYKRAS